MFVLVKHVEISSKATVDPTDHDWGMYFLYKTEKKVGYKTRVQ